MKSPIFRSQRAAKAALPAVAAVALVVVGAPAPVAAATVVRCGQTVTVSVTLANDVGPCPGDGIVVGADGITINLNGHRVLGPPGRDDHVGIRFPRRVRATVTNGEVSRFGAGVAIVGGGSNVVSALSVRDNIGFRDASGDFGDGIVIFDSPRNILRGNVVRHNGPFDGIGVFGQASIANVIADNVVADNNIARLSPELGEYLNLDDGINLGAGLSGGSRTTVMNNVVTGNGLNGINACSIRGVPCLTTLNVIRGNLVQGNGFGDPTTDRDTGDVGDGIRVVSIRPPGRDLSDFFPPTHDVVANNRVLENAADGIVVGSSENRILYNYAAGNGRAFPDFFYDLDDLSFDGNCDANVWRGNAYGTAYPACTTLGGQQLGPGSSAAADAGPSRAAPTEPTPVPRRRVPSF